MFSIYWNIFYGRIYHDVREKFNCSQTEKTEKKHPVYEDKSGSRRKVVIVRGTLILNFIIRTIFGKCWCILYYCGPTMDFYKNFTNIFTNSTHTTKHPIQRSGN